MKYISLTRKKFAIVDDEDFNYLNQWKWYCNNWGYAIRGIWNPVKKNNDFIFMHNIILPTKIGFENDHINGNKLDNRKENLRYVTSSQNKMNTKIYKNNTSGFKGVYWHKDKEKWMALIHCDRKKTFIGYFKIKNQAIKARFQKEKELFGDFSRLM